MFGDRRSGVIRSTRHHLGHSYGSGFSQIQKGRFLVYVKLSSCGKGEGLSSQLGTTRDTAIMGLVSTKYRKVRTWSGSNWSSQVVRGLDWKSEVIRSSWASKEFNFSQILELRYALFLCSPGDGRWTGRVAISISGQLSTSRGTALGLISARYKNVGSWSGLNWSSCRKGFGLEKWGYLVNSAPPGSDFSQVLKAR